MLGVMHERGQGVAPSMPEALKWYDLAARRGLPAAMYNQGLAYAMARGVPQDYAKAYFWFKLAQRAGLDDAARAASFVGQFLGEKQKNVLDSRVEACQIQNSFKNCEIN
jgi:TPR repeat protein